MGQYGQFPIKVRMKVSSSASLLGDYEQEWRGSETADFAGRWGLLLGSHRRFEDSGPDWLRRPNIRPDSELGPCVVPPDC